MDSNDETNHAAVRSLLTLITCVLPPRPCAATVGKQGVDDVILVDGAKTISLQNEQAEIQEMIVSTNETVMAAGGVVDTDMGELLESVRSAFRPPTIPAQCT